MINLAQNNVKGNGESKIISSISYNCEKSVGNKEQTSPANEKSSKFDNENSENSDSLVMNFLEEYPGSGCEYTSNNSSAIVSLQLLEPFPGSCSEYNPSSTSSEAESNPEFSPITPKLKKKKLNSRKLLQKTKTPIRVEKNNAKYLKNHGMDHYNKKGQLIPKKELKEGCKESKDIRTQIFQNFYKNGSKEFQWAFIANLITLHKKIFVYE
ncbi:hypothetical protein FF38_09100 [Lucilia cuprina]|uniref:Uncharacterized protein n=1 Tax=Lucilia cuprina TaxID=7375 RepID=A0A0L0BSI5_LUCCU|nr:hypothetical protein FF38_09100 [Lucilia cuprina]